MGIADDENNDDDDEAEAAAEEAEGGTTMMSMAMAMVMRMRLRVENRDDAREMEMEMCDVRWKLVLTPAMTLTATNWASQGQTEVLTNWGEVGRSKRVPDCQTVRLLDGQPDERLSRDGASDAVVLGCLLSPSRAKCKSSGPKFYICFMYLAL